MLEKRRDRGERVPALDNEPVIADGLDLYWQAFTSLSRRRPWGRLPQAIPVAEIVAYCDAVGCRDRETMLQLVTALDDHYLEYARSKAAAGMKQPPAPPVGTRRR